MERKATPTNILDDLMSAAPAGAVKPAVEDTAIIRQQLRYDYSQLGAAGAEVQEHAVALKGFERKANEAVIEAGRRLIAVKAALQHGQWCDWLAVEFGMSERTAQTMMAIAQRFDGEIRKFADLGTSVLGLLASPSVPDTAVEAVAQVVAEEGRVSVTRAKQIIQHEKFLAERAKRRDDAAEDAWRPAQDTPRYQPPVGRPMMEVIKTDEELAAAAEAADIASRNAAADEAIRQAQAAAKADVAFGMATDKGAAQYASLLEAVADALPEIAKITGKTIDVSVLKAALRPVHDALIDAAVARPQAAPATELPADLVAHGWELRQARQGGMWFAAITPPDEEREITTVKRSKIADVIGDCRFMERSLKIGAPA